MGELYCCDKRVLYAAGKLLLGGTSTSMLLSSCKEGFLGLGPSRADCWRLCWLTHGVSKVCEIFASSGPEQQEEEKFG